MHSPERSYRQHRRADSARIGHHPDLATTPEAGSPSAEPERSTRWDMEAANSSAEIPGRQLVYIVSASPPIADPWALSGAGTALSGYAL